MILVKSKKEVAIKNLLKEIDSILLNENISVNWRNNLYIPLFRAIINMVLFKKENLSFSELISEVRHQKFNCDLLIAELDHLKKIQYDTKSYYPYNKNNLKNLLNNFLVNLFEGYNAEQMSKISVSIKNDLLKTYQDDYVKSYLSEDFDHLENNLSFFYETDVLQKILLDLKNQVEKSKQKLSSQGFNDEEAEVFLNKINMFSPFVVNPTADSKLSNNNIPDVDAVRSDYSKKLEDYLEFLFENKFSPSQVKDFLLKIGFSEKYIGSLELLKSCEFPEQTGEAVTKLQPRFHDFRKEVSKVVVAQGNVIDSFILAILSGGHVLVEGVPGLAKTTIIKVIGAIIDCELKRIQFTADMLPSDIIGFNTYNQGFGFSVIKGPIFTNLVLADEINRASAKVQSALLEAMEEKTVTIGKKTYMLNKPFLVFATQNPIDTIGTYGLPQAQLDRFLYKVNIDYLSTKNEYLIIDQNLQTSNFEDYKVKKLFSRDEILFMQQFVNKIFISSRLKKYVVDLVNETRTTGTYNIKLRKYIEWGAGPRATIHIITSSKANALLNGRTYVIDQDIKDVIYLILKHRIIINYEGQAREVTSEQVIDEILRRVPIP